LLVADLLEDIGQQARGLLVVGLGVYQLVQDFLGQQVLAFVVKLPAAGENLRRAAHHFDVQGSGIAGRQRDERRGIAVPETQVAVDHAPAVVLHRSVVASAFPLLLQALRQIVDVVDLVDRDPLVGQVQDLVVEVGVQVALGAQDVLYPVVAPPRPVVGPEQDLGFLPIQIERRVDVLRPVQGIAHQCPAQRVDAKGNEREIPQRMYSLRMLPGRRL
jgi:hypothetical protein